MLSLPSSVRIFVARDAVDFCKAHDGLLAVVRDAFGDDPFDAGVRVRNLTATPKTNLANRFLKAETREVRRQA